MWSNVGHIDEAMQELTHNYQGLARIIYQKQKEIQFLETKAVNLSMFYVASQLVIFLSDSKSACRKSWKPVFFLSLSIAVAFLLNFGATVVKYVRTKNEQERNYVDQGENFHRMDKHRRRGKTIYNGTRHEQKYEIRLDMQEHEGFETRPDMSVVYQLYGHLGLTAAALLAITGLVLHACRSSVCPR